MVADALDEPVALHLLQNSGEGRRIMGVGPRQLALRNSVALARAAEDDPLLHRHVMRAQAGQQDPPKRHVDPTYEVAKRFVQNMASRLHRPRRADSGYAKRGRLLHTGCDSIFNGEAQTGLSCAADIRRRAQERLGGRRKRYPDHVWLSDDGRGNLACTNPNALTTAFRRHLDKLGFGGLKITPLHGFRANFATVSLNDLGGDSRTVATLLNFAHFKTTKRAYLAGLSKQKRRALTAFEREYLAGVVDAELMQAPFSAT